MDPREVQNILDEVLEEKFELVSVWQRGESYLAATLDADGYRVVFLVQWFDEGWMQYWDAETVYPSDGFNIADWTWLAGAVGQDMLWVGMEGS